MYTQEIKKEILYILYRSDVESHKFSIFLLNSNYMKTAIIFQLKEEFYMANLEGNIIVAYGKIKCFEGNVKHP